MKQKKIIVIAGVVAGVFLGVKYILPVILPFFIGWILAEAVYPLARRISNGRTGRKLHITESGAGAVLILALTALTIWGIFAGAGYLVDKIGECVRYYPVIKEEAGEFLKKCCEGAEHLVGIPAEESGSYIYRWIENLGDYFWQNGRGMDKAVDSVKWCVVFVTILAIAVVAAILFLQERKKIEKFLEGKEFFRRIRHLSKELSLGFREYIKAQIKIMGIITLICIAGFWILRIKHFLLLGILIGLLDAFPVLGTGTFLIPGGIILLVWGDTGQALGFFLLYLVTAGSRQFLEPRLVGKCVGISPLLVLLSVYLGVLLYGGMGFILGPLSGILLYGIIKEWELLKV